MHFAPQAHQCLLLGLGIVLSAKKTWGPWAAELLRWEKSRLLIAYCYLREGKGRECFRNTVHVRFLNGLSAAL